MAELPQVKRNIFEEETQFRGSVSEAIAQKLGSSVNFINYRQHDVKEFRVNGNYSHVILPFYGIDGIYIVRYDIEILGVAMYSVYGGTSGTTEFDLKYSTASNGAWTSVLSTTPKIDFNAHTTPADPDKEVWVTSFSTAPTNTVAPVIATTNIDSGWALRMDMLQAQAAAQQAGLIVYFRPR